MMLLDTVLRHCHGCLYSGAPASRFLISSSYSTFQDTDTYPASTNPNSKAYTHILLLSPNTKSKRDGTTQKNRRAEEGYSSRTHSTSNPSQHQASESEVGESFGPAHSYRRSRRATSTVNSFKDQGSGYLECKKAKRRAGKRCRLPFRPLPRNDRAPASSTAAVL